MEYSSSSETLCRQVLELIHSLGGRATYTVKGKVRYTSPRQPTPKAARASHRLTNIRLPDELTPFRRTDRALLMKPNRFARQWRVRDIESAGRGQAVAVVVTAQDGRWICAGPAVLTGSPAETAIRRDVA